MNIREASPTDLPQIDELLKRSKLPSEDCGEHLANLFVVVEDNQIIGVGGLEICGHLGLVRSIAVALEYQGRGAGKQLYQSVEKKALELDINKLYLLTNTASDYFRKLGFSQIARTDTPAQIVATREFSELCPESAIVVYREVVKM